MFRNAFHALMYWAPALLICVAVGARATAPFPYGMTDRTETLTESVVQVVRELPDKSELYVKIDGGDPTAEMLSELNSRKLSPTFAPWSARRPTEDHCRSGGVMADGCLKDNFLLADLLSMPLWHVALVRVKTGICTAELTLLQGVTQWHVVSQRTTCT